MLFGSVVTKELMVRTVYEGRRRTKTLVIKSLLRSSGKTWLPIYTNSDSYSEPPLMN